MQVIFWNAEWRYWTSTQLRFPRLHLKPSAICSECAPSVRAIGAVDETLRATPAKPEWKDYCPNVETLMALDAMPWTSRREW